jgi:hypothetical protein
MTDRSDGSGLALPATASDMRQPLEKQAPVDLRGELRARLATAYHPPGLDGHRD